MIDSQELNKIIKKKGQWEGRITLFGVFDSFVCGL